MDRGDSASSALPARREPDALSTWLARERNAWWRQWRWAVYIAFSITGLRMLYSFSVTLYLMWFASLSDRSTPLAKNLVSFFGTASKTAVRIQWFLPELMLLAALVLALTFLERSEVPIEIAVTQKRRSLYRWRMSSLRRVFWTWIGLLVVAPDLVDDLIYLIEWLLPATGHSIADPVRSLSFASGAAVSIAWLTCYCIVAEWGALFATKQLPRSYKWLLAVIAPPLLLFAVDKAVDALERSWTLSILSRLQGGIYAFSGRNWTIISVASAIVMLGIVALVLLWRHNSRMPANYTGVST